MTDARPLNTTLLSGMAGGVGLPKVAQVGSQASAGNFGVAVVTSVTKDQAVTSSTTVSVATLTTPNDGANHIVRCWIGFSVGAGNTNNGTCGATVAFTDPVQGAIARGFTDSDLPGAFLLSAAITKGTSDYGLPFQVEASPNTAVTVKYQNSASGTISDKVSATIELLA